MGDVINLRDARKRRERAAKDAKAAANRSRFGRTRAERTRQETERERDVRGLDGHRREPSDEADGDDNGLGPGDRGGG